MPVRATARDAGQGNCNSAQRTSPRCNVASARTATWSHRPPALEIAWFTGTASTF